MTREQKIEEMLTKLLKKVEESEILDSLVTNPDSDWALLCEEAHKILSKK